MSPHVSDVIVAVDPYTYTTGRWLNRDNLERQSRYIKFDFAALCKRTVDLCPGASRVARYENKDGGFNRVFVMTMDDGTKIVAKLPTRIAGPQRLVTNSEVATMTYCKHDSLNPMSARDALHQLIAQWLLLVRSHNTIPVPEILDWSDNDSNPIGAEYVIMEHVAGVRLHERWPTMTSLQHMLCVKALSMMVKEMAAIAFPAYGNLYFSDAPIDPHLKLDLVDGFHLGPHCGATYWNCNAGEARLYGESNHYRGPCESNYFVFDS